MHSFTDTNQYNIKKRLHVSFRRFLTIKTGSGTYLKYTSADVWFIRNYLSKKFICGMSWDNYGSYWVVDNIVPLRLFDLTKEDEIKLSWHYKNLMPLLKEDNLYKEGDLRFSEIVLTMMLPCDIVQKLLDVNNFHLAKMDKYLNGSKA